MVCRYIMHVDGDAFFAACEVSRRPDLRGRPVVVGEDRGIACALTYEAKRLGVTRGMPIFQIRKEYKGVTVLTSHFELYERFHRKLVDILRRHLQTVESYSIDECFALLPETLSRLDLETFVRSLKMEIQEALGITFSFGIATTKTLAKLASKMGKPDGCFFLLEEQSINEALKVPIASIWGIGRAVSAELIGRNILTASDFVSANNLSAHFSSPVLSTKFELQGRIVYPVSNETHDKKSIQATRSLSKRTSDRSMLFSELSRNIETACAHLRESGLLTNRVYFYFKTDQPFRTRVGRQVCLESFTDDPRIILKAVEGVLDQCFDKSLSYKSTGITLSDLRRRDFIPVDLFGSQVDSLDQSSYISIVDAINRKFGSWSLMQASSMKSVGVRSLENQERDQKDNYEYGLPLTYMGEAN